MVRAQVRVALAEQVLGQTLGAAGQGCGARDAGKHTHQGISLALGAAANGDQTTFAKRLGERLAGVSALHRAKKTQK